MTTVEQLKGLFDAQYNRECRRRGVTPEFITNGEFSMWYYIVANRIYEETNLANTTTYINLTPVTVFTEYEIGAGFGGLAGYELAFSDSAVSNNKLEIVDESAIPHLGNLEVGIPRKMAIYAKADGSYYVTLYPLVSNTGQLKITYKRVIEIPNGSGTNTDLDFDVDLPRVWHPLLLRGLMAQAFPDLEDKFEAWLRTSIHKRPNPKNDSMHYNFGGLDDEEIDNGFSKNFNGEI